MKCIQSDYTDGGCLIYPNNSSCSLIVITERGYVNKLPFSSIPKDGRGKKGFNVIKLSKTDSIKFIHPCNDFNTIRINMANGDFIDINICDIEYGSSISPGSRISNSNISNKIMHVGFIK